MRRRGSHSADEAEVDMTPMLDIVFIMLIFFIVTATFMDEKGPDITQPPPPPPDQAETKPKPAIVVYVNQHDLCTVDGQPSECTNIRLSVEKLLAEKANAAVILRMDERSKHGTLIQIKDDLAVAGVDTKIEVIKISA